jgi:tetratricopeptide (TPR) repeat protein
MALGPKCALALAVLMGVSPRAAAAQSAAPGTLSRALDFESANKCAEAFPLYRQALSEGDVAGALLGLERCAAQIGRADTLLAVVDSVLVRRPRDPMARMVQLRTLVGMQRFDQSRVAFDQWVVAAPRDPAPYREYARQLLDIGRTRAADTVLQLATRALGNPREIAAELAELRGALGMWEASAKSWRDAIALSPFLEASAIYVLSQAPPPARDSVRDVLGADPAEVHARKILAGLELRWRSAREAWMALSVLPPSDTVVQAWVEFAVDAEQQNAWRPARDAYAAALKNGAERALALRAATAAIRGDEAGSALPFLDMLGAPTDSTLVPAVLVMRIRALSALGRPVEADSALNASGSLLDPASRSDATRALAWGWIRVGDLAKARASLARAGADPDDRAAAWIALYEGDLKTARAGLRRLDETSRETVIAMSLLARTRIDTSPKAGAAFLALVRSDSAEAAPLFEASATELPDAAPLLLGIAARLYATTSDSARSLTIWQTIVDTYPQTPEAPESELEWAKTLRRHGDSREAIARLEHLILTYPQSALVPQARRELEIAKSAIPPVVTVSGALETRVRLPRGVS